MTELARILRHPTQPELVVVDIPSSLNNEMARFEAARLSRELHGFVMHNDHIPAFYRFARTITLHVVDERTPARASGGRTLPVECGNCQQAGSLGKPPKVCPACGQDWAPVNPPIRIEARGVTECVKCKARQPGRFPFCANCGEPMVYEIRPAAPAKVLDFDAVRARKRKLVDPMSLRSALHRLGEVMPDPAGPKLSPYHRGRRVENVDLPDPEPGEGGGDEGPGW